MTKEDGVFIYIGTYPSDLAAQAAYQTIKDLHAVRGFGTYDAAVVTKDFYGYVHENKDEMATRHGAWAGLAVGAVLGLLFPPIIPASAAIGAAVGGVGGHLWRGMSRSDVKKLGDLIDGNEACLLVVGEAKVADAINNSRLQADKEFSTLLDVDVKHLDAAIQDAASHLANTAPAVSVSSGDTPTS